MRFGRSGDAIEVIMDFFKRTSPVAIAYLELLIFDILFFVMIVTGKQIFRDGQVHLCFGIGCTVVRKAFMVEITKRLSSSECEKQRIYARMYG